MRLEAYGTSHIGLVRSRNEDEWLILNTGTRSTGNVSAQAIGPDSNPFLFAVIDGMGGVAGGDVAARMTAEVLLAATFSGSPASTEGALRSLALRAHEAVQMRGEEDPALRGMGAVATVALLEGMSLAVLQLGDTRLYVFRDNRLTQLTEDQSLVGELLATGRIDAAQARRHPLRNMVDQAIGGPHPPEAVFGRHELFAGDRLLFCTDGLAEMLPDAAVRLVLDQEREIEPAAEALIHGALSQGGRDNVTVLLVAVDEDPLFG